MTASSMETRPSRPAGWPILDGAAMYGLARKVVDYLAPHTEADPAAMLADFLISFGSAAGIGPYMSVGAARHHARDNVCLVGETAKARKGTARAEVRGVMEHADPAWATSRVKGGLASGEGLISAVRDSDDDDGVSDKRLLDVEPEFARVLTVAGREGSIVSHVIRDAWDTGRLENMTKRAPLVATNAHVSMIGHVTLDELRRRLTETEAMNGFGNRFLWILVTRSRLLPSGGHLNVDNYAHLGGKVKAVLAEIRRFSRLDRTPEAERLWEFLYGVIAEQDERGLLGSLTARAETHLLRLSLIYALTDASQVVDVPHLEAAWSLLCYADDSARFIFGAQTGNPVADRLLTELRRRPRDQGLDGTQQRDLFSRHVKGKVIEGARQHLEECGLVENVTVPTEGRTRVVTYLRGDESDLGDRGRDMSLRSLRSHAACATNRRSNRGRGGSAGPPETA